MFKGMVVPSSLRTTNNVKFEPGPGTETEVVIVSPACMLVRFNVVVVISFASGGIESLGSPSYIEIGSEPLIARSPRLANLNVMLNELSGQMGGVKLIFWVP